ncbi:MAG TPA: XrtB/PEP-CTERM-associated transcriptional regulator EpsA [Rhodocyclaceae bacterium]|nr:XrtB/PEP-CTERM-associated transcriptional regulator EpsA [Rhodocyclaceae bacterium]
MSVVTDLSAQEHERFLRIVQESLVVDRHFHLFLWLQGEIQSLLPHEIFISMVGNFATEDVAVDVISSLPRLRAQKCLKCGLGNVAKDLHARWKRNGYQLMSLRGEFGQLLHAGECECPLAPIFSGRGSMLAHGLQDGRNGEDALYLVMHPEPVLAEHERRMFTLLLPQIDFACRRAASLTDDGVVSRLRPGQTFDLSAREREILDWVRMGKTNDEIGSILNISAFTVKNHLQRIYRKMDVLNRAQAVAKLEDTGRRRAPAGR